MGFSVSDNKIIMTRGDTAKILVSIKHKDTQEPYIPKEGDTVRFSMKKYISDKEPTLIKDIPISSLYLILNPEDTKDLDYGIYHFDVQLTYKNGDVDTFIPNSILKLTSEAD